jgi:hypothetical protein
VEGSDLLPDHPSELFGAEAMLVPADVVVEADGKLDEVGRWHREGDGAVVVLIDAHLMDRFRSWNDDCLDRREGI